GEVARDAAALVEHLGIDDSAWLARHVVGADAAEGGLGVGAGDEVLGEARLVEHGHRLARGAMLAADRLEPVLPAEAVTVLGRLSGPREPVGPLPAELLAEAGAARLQHVVQARSPARASARMPVERPRHGVVLAVGLE